MGSRATQAFWTGGNLQGTKWQWGNSDDTWFPWQSPYPLANMTDYDRVWLKRVDGKWSIENVQSFSWGIPLCESSNDLKEYGNTQLH